MEKKRGKGGEVPFRWGLCMQGFSFLTDFGRNELCAELPHSGWLCVELPHSGLLASVCCQSALLLKLHGDVFCLLVRQSGNWKSSYSFPDALGGRLLGKTNCSSMLQYDSCWLFSLVTLRQWRRTNAAYVKQGREQKHGKHACSCERCGVQQLMMKCNWRAVMTKVDAA